MERELRFENTDRNKVMVFKIDDFNIVNWYTLPNGEEGTSMQFSSPEVAEEFSHHIAKSSGFKPQEAKEIVL